MGQERVAIGLSGGFIEPLESTGLAIVQMGGDRPDLAAKRQTTADQLAPLPNHYQYLEEQVYQGVSRG